MAFDESITNLGPWGVSRLGYSWDRIEDVTYDQDTYLVVVILGTHTLTITGGETRSNESHIDIGCMIRI